MEPLHLRKNLLSLETLSALCVLRNRRKSHSNTSSTATRRGTIDSRDASLLSTVELPFSLGEQRVHDSHATFVGGA